MTRPPPITRSGAQRDAQHELAKPIYHQNAEPLPVRAVKWFAHLVNRVLDHASTRAPGGTLGAFALALLVGVVIGLIVWRVGIPRRVNAGGGVFSAAAARTAAEHRAAAGRAALDQDWNTAVMEGMRAVARELEERGTLDPRAGRTASELAREAAGALPAAATSLSAAATVFNAVAYGGTMGSADDVATMIAADDAVRRSGRTTVSAR